MPHHPILTLDGVIEHVFAHRFTLRTGQGVCLADLGPRGALAFALAPGLAITMQGEQRPSEIKVTRIARQGGQAVAIDHPKPHHGPKAHHHPDLPADPQQAIRAAEQAGWTVVGEADRKPRHFEVLAYQGDGDWTELHIDFAGSIYKHKPADAQKWNIQ